MAWFLIILLTGLTEVNGITLRSNCSSEGPLVILNGLYTGLFFFTFIVSVPSLWLNSRYWKMKISTEINESLLLAIPIALTLLAFNESFQWVFLYKGSYIGSIACQLVAAVREYALVTLIPLMTCFGVHLFIVLLQPKCLMVIDEVKRARQKKLLIVYLVVSFVSPVFFVPWPFMTGNYGGADYLCWIAYVECKGGLLSVILDQVLLWHAWAAVFCIFTAIVTVFILFILCQSSGRGNLNMYTMLCFMVVFLIIVVLNIAGAIVAWVDSPSLMTLSLTFAIGICTPLGNLFVSVVNIFRVLHHLRSIPRPIRAVVIGYATIQQV